MATTCQLCGSPADEAAREVPGRLSGVGELPVSVEEILSGLDHGDPTPLCADHAEAVQLLRTVCPDADAIEERLRGDLYQELDVLAFAFEMEASEALEQGDEDEAARAQHTRLGIRLAQRLVGGVPAPEVGNRLRQRREEYASRFPR